MNILKNEQFVENVVTPALATIKGYFPKAFLILTVFCLLYAAYLGVRYYLAKKDEDKLAKEKILIKKGAISVVVMYVVLILIRIAFAVIVRFFGVAL